MKATIFAVLFTLFIAGVAMTVIHIFVTWITGGSGRQNKLDPEELIYWNEMQKQKEVNNNPYSDDYNEDLFMNSDC